MKNVTPFLLAVMLLNPLSAVAQENGVNPFNSGTAAPGFEEQGPRTTDGNNAEALPPPTVGPGAGGHTLAELETIALANNPTLAQAAARMQAARGRYLQVGLYPNPVIGYQAEEIGNEGTAGLQGGFVSQEIVRGGKLSLNRAVAGREVAQAEQQLEIQRYRVLNDVRTEFYNVLAAQRTRELTQELVDLGEQGVQAADELLKALEVSRVDLLQARVEVNSARIALENAQNRYEGAWRRLATVIGMPDMPPQPVTGDLESNVSDLTWETAVGQLLSASPEVTTARIGVDRARRSLSRALAEPIPNLNLQAGVMYDDGTNDTVANVQIGFPLPVHNRNQGAIRQAQAEVAVAESEVARIELNLQNRLARAYERYANARNQVAKYAREILPDARESLELVRTGYRGGEFSFLVLLTAQRTYFQANLAYLDALRELNEASVSIEGLLLTDSLQAQPDVVPTSAPQ